MVCFTVNAYLPFRFSDKYEIIFSSYAVINVEELYCLPCLLLF